MSTPDRGALAPGAGLEARPGSVTLLTDAVGRPGDGAALAAALDDSVADAPSADRNALVLAALRAVLPVTRAWLTSHGWPEADAVASIADVDRKVGRYGLRGTGTDWLCEVATGRVVAVGRLQFERAAHLADGTRCWGVHVPETGPLDPEACDDAFRRAPALLRTLDPDDAATVWSCRSWILDPGLATAIGPDANLSHFAQRFRLLPSGPDDGAEGDESVAKFVFGLPLADARAADPVGRVQRAVTDRWRSGGHWQERSGARTV